MGWFEVQANSPHWCIAPTSRKEYHWRSISSHIPGILCAGLILSPLAIQYVMVILLLSVRRTKLSYPSRNLSPAQAVKVNMWWQLENLGQSPGVERSPYRANKANKGNLKSPLISSREESETGIVWVINRKRPFVPSMGNLIKWHGRYLIWMICWDTWGRRNSAWNL